MDKRFDAFSTPELTTLYQALCSKDDEDRSRVMRDHIYEILEQRKAVIDKVFGLAEDKLTEAGTPAPSAGFRAYWAGASPDEAAACDRGEL